MAGTAPHAHLILGGARSGKTTFALRAAEAAGPRRLYVATAEAGDAEMAARIAAHRAERGAGWTTRETPLALAQALRDLGDTDVCLVDCLTLWLSNVMQSREDVTDAIQELCAALCAARHPIVLVTNEVGLGLVPGTALGRRFRDAQGRLNQRIAEVAGEVTFIAAGLPLRLKAP